MVDKEAQTKLIGKFSHGKPQGLVLIESKVTKNRLYFGYINDSQLYHGFGHSEDSKGTKFEGVFYKG